MKKILYSALLFLLAVACADDDSTMIYPDQNPDFSKITITSPTEKLSVDFGQEFVFKPTVSQLKPEKTLQYIWTANKRTNQGALQDQFSCGEGETLKYIFKELGTYRLRLEVKNEDYSELKEWELNVRAYDEGLIISGMNDAGEVNISFARTLSQTDIAEGKELAFDVDIFKKVNPGISLNKIIKLQKSVTSWESTAPANLYIFTEDKIYIADHLTFNIFSVVDFAAQYPGHKIAQVQILDETNPDARIITDKKKAVRFSKKEFLLYNSNNNADKRTFDKVYDRFFYSSGVNLYSTFASVDYTESKIYLFYPNMGRYYTNTTLVQTTPPINDDNYYPNIYEDRDIIAVAQMNGNSFNTSPLIDYYTVSVSRNDPNDIMIVQCYYYMKNEAGQYIYGVFPFNKFSYTAPSGITLKREADIIANDRYKSMYYSNGSKVYVWYPNNVAPNNQLPVNAAIDLGTGKEVTAMAVSFDMKELYVGFYDSNRVGDLKGGMYIYKAADIGIVSNIQPVKKFEGITYRPVQVGYKSLQQGKYTSEDN